MRARCGVARVQGRRDPGQWWVVGRRLNNVQQIDRQTTMMCIGRCLMLAAGQHQLDGGT